MRWGKPPIHRISGDRFAVDLPGPERTLLVNVADQMAELLENPDNPGLHRSFPPAYQGVENLEHADEYRRLMTSELADKHREALATLAESAEATELDGEQLGAWMRALTQVRLILGTELGIEGNDDDLPDRVEAQIYDYLTYVQSLVIDALASDL